MTWVPSLTHDDEKRGKVDDVAQIIISVVPSAVLIIPLRLSMVGILSPSTPDVRSCTVASGNLATVLLCKHNARSLRDLLMIVQSVMEGKCRKNRSRWDSTCCPAPKTVMDFGRGAARMLVDRSDPANDSQDIFRFF